MSPAQNRVNSAKCCVSEGRFSFVCVLLKSDLNVATTHGGCEARVAASCREIGLSVESGCLVMQPKVGGKLHPRLNMTLILIANKYREGKLKRTLKRELNSA